MKVFLVKLKIRVAIEAQNSDDAARCIHEKIRDIPENVGHSGTYRVLNPTQHELNQFLANISE